MKTYPIVEITFSPTGGTKKSCRPDQLLSGKYYKYRESYPARCQLFRCSSPF